MLPRPDSELATPGADDLGDSFSFPLLSSPTTDHLSLDVGQDLFGWETALDWFNSAPFIDSLARDPRP
jgi:hypothetical protein